MPKRGRIAKLLQLKEELINKLWYIHSVDYVAIQRMSRWSIEDFDGSKNNSVHSDSEYITL